MKSSTRGWVMLSVVCLVPLAVIWVIAGALVPQSSFEMWLLLEATILISAASAATFSLLGFPDRSPLLKVLGVITFLVAVILGPLEAIWFL